MNTTDRAQAIAAYNARSHGNTGTRLARLKEATAQALREELETMAYNKYKAVKVNIDGITFDSKAEAHRYSELKIMQAGRLIYDLELQPEFHHMINGQKMFTYRADFKYIEHGRDVIEDVKGVCTPIFNLKRRIIQAEFGIEIRMVDKHGNRIKTKSGRVKK